MITVLQEMYQVGGYLPWSAEANVTLPREMSRAEALAVVAAELSRLPLPQRVVSMALTSEATPRGWAPPRESFGSDRGLHARVHLRADSLRDVRHEDRAPTPTSPPESEGAS